MKTSLTNYRAAILPNRRSVMAVAIAVALPVLPVLPAQTDTTVTLPGNVPLELVRISKGTFVMGSSEPVSSPWQNCSYGGTPCEQPAHTDTISYDFYIGKYELTQEQWASVIGRNPAGSTMKNCRRCAVEHVSWKDCQIFCQAINALKLGHFRLPSEAEWEYAARAGSGSRFFFGNSGCTPSPDVYTSDNTYNCPELTRYAWWSFSPGLQGHAMEVGLLLPNPWGLYDVYGNVYEWCEDEGDAVPSAYNAGDGAPCNGSPWIVAETGWKILRGGFRGYSRSARFTSYFRATHQHKWILPSSVQRFSFNRDERLLDNGSVITVDSTGKVCLDQAGNVFRGDSGQISTTEAVIQDFRHDCCGFRVAMEAPGEINPAVPRNVTTSVTSTSVTVSWNPPVLSGAAAGGYTVYRNGRAAATTVQTSFVDTGLAPSTWYRYAVKGVLAGGKPGSATFSEMAKTLDKGASVAPRALYRQDMKRIFLPAMISHRRFSNAACEVYDCSGARLGSIRCNKVCLVKIGPKAAGTVFTR